MEQAFLIPPAVSGGVYLMSLIQRPRTDNQQGWMGSQGKTQVGPGRELPRSPPIHELTLGKAGLSVPLSPVTGQQRGKYQLYNYEHIWGRKKQDAASSITTALNCLCLLALYKQWSKGSSWVVTGRVEGQPAAGSKPHPAVSVPSSQPRDTSFIASAHKKRET